MMQSYTHFGAPWGTSLKVMTGISVLILVGISFMGIVIGLSQGMMLNPIWFLSMVIMPLGLVLGGLLFVIRGYVLTNQTLLIQRLGWNSRISLSNLVSAEIDSQAMQGSIRTFGNGGLFCFAGAFWNRKLGHYRVFATRLDRTVVLRFTNRTVVVTPDRPEAFVEQVRALKG